MKQLQNIRGFVVAVVLSLFIIFFVGKEINAETGKTSWMIVSDGLNHFRQGMDIAGGVRLTYKIDFSKYNEIYTNQTELTQVTTNAQNIILKNIDGRISSLGVSDYNSYIQSLNDGSYVVVEIGGVSDLDQAKDIIGKTVELEFKLPYLGDGQDQRIVRQTLAEEILRQGVATPDLLRELVANRQSDNIYIQRYSNVPLEQLPEVYWGDENLFTNWATGSVYPVLLEGVYAQSVQDINGIPETIMLEGWVISKLVDVSTEESTDASGNIRTETLYTIEDVLVEYNPLWVTAQDPKSNAILNGAFFKYANVQQSQTGQPVVIINFDDKGKEIFCNITEEIIGQQLAIFVGGELVTAPVIREKICGGSAQIDGQFSILGAKELVDNLNEGALPAPLILAHEEKVSPTLGHTALNGAMIAAGIGLIVIAFFMFSMYGWRKGLVALLTLLSFLLILFAIIKIIGYALSLSGIAAILLSLGMGVDANVLIYERVREEMKLDKSTAAAIEEGYERSLSAIRDGNLTTFMIALLLFFMGTNVFKGFGTMMMLNIVLTLIVIVPLTKILLLTLYRRTK